MYAVIIGGTLFASELAKKLLSKKNKVVAVILDKEQAVELSATEGLIVINDNPVDANVLDDLNLQKCDVFVSATQKDEINILSALYAKNAGIRKIFVKTNSPETEKILNRLSIESVNSASYAASAVELKLTRPVVAELVSSDSGHFDVVEINVNDYPELVGRPISDIKGEFYSAIAMYNQGNFRFVGESGIEKDSILIIIMNAGKVKELDKALKQGKDSLKSRLKEHLDKHHVLK